MVAAGLVLIDKPQGWTSHDVVGRARRLLGTRKVGHAGTLDPMATGLLVCGFGQGTRLLTYITGADKEYQATVRLGVATDTDDADGNVVSTSDLSESATDVARRLPQACEGLTGVISQVPSSVSAIKVAGKRAYQRVRDGEDVVLPARQVEISRLRLDQTRIVQNGSTVLDVDISVACSSGTYVRAVARDLGAALGTGGHLTMLRRTRVGRFRVEDAQPIDPLPGQLVTVPIADACRDLFPVVRVGAEIAARLALGQRVAFEKLQMEESVAVVDPDNDVVAIATNVDGVLAPKLVFAR